jgi:hypothetical protein
MTPSLRAKALTHTDAPRPAPGSLLPTPTGGRPRKTERPQRFPQRETHPITIMSPTFSWSRTEISLGARAHDEPNRLTTRNHSPPSIHGQPDPHLTGGPCTDKQDATGSRAGPAPCSLLAQSGHVSRGVGRDRILWEQVAAAFTQQHHESDHRCQIGGVIGAVA